MKGNKYIIIVVCLFLAVAVVALCSSGSDQYEPQNDYVLTGNTMTQSDEKATWEITPHTLSSSGWVTVNIKNIDYTGDMDIMFGFNDDVVKVSKIETLGTPQTVEHTNNDFQSFDEWHHADCLAIEKNTEYTFRVWLDIPISLGQQTGEYYIALKPSAMDMYEAIKTGNFLYIDPWWDSYWNYYKSLTLNQTMINDSIGTGHYTLLVEYTDTDLITKAQADGDDIVFTSSDNVTLPHQLSKFNSTTGYIKAYVGLSDITNVTGVNMYYNNSGAANTENKSGTWGENASGIWLMDEGSGNYTNDSSGNSNNGIINNASWDVGGLNFSGNGDYVDIPHNDLTLNWTIIIKSHNNLHAPDSANGAMILGRGGTTSTTDFIYCTDNLRTKFSNSSGASVIWITDVDFYNKYRTHAFVADTSGIEYFLETNTQGKQYIVPTLKFYEIGRGYTTLSYDYNGIIKYIYLYNRALSSAEITTTYNNTDEPELFISVGSEQSQAAGDTTAPTYSSNGTNNTIAGQSTLFYIQFNDDTALHTNGQYIFSTNNTGAWVNESAVNFTATPQYANKTLTLNASVGVPVGYMWYGTDNTSNAGNTPIYTVTTCAGDTPTITSWENNKTNNNTLNITVNAGENILFNATANQCIDTWNWNDIVHNYNNISIAFQNSGLNHVTVNATNPNGTSNDTVWNVTVIGNTYYIDYENGNDSNNGTSTSTPWKHAPGMYNCSDNCLTRQNAYSVSSIAGAGDRFILRGGVTWTQEVFSWDWIYGCGTETSPIYFGVDKTWYNGSSWSRPVLDMEGEEVTYSPEGIHSMLRLYGSWLTVDNFEFTGVAQLHGIENGYVANMLSIAPSYTHNGGEVKNCYFHGWSHGPITNSTWDEGVQQGQEACDNSIMLLSASVAGGNMNLTIHNNVWDGSDTTQDMVMAYRGSAGHFYNNYITKVQNGIIAIGGKYYWGNTFKDIAQVDNMNPASHMNSIECMGSQTIIYNNLFDNVGGGVTMWVQPPIYETDYIFNNVVIDDTNCGIQISTQSCYNCSSTGIYVFGNSLHGASHVNSKRISGPAESNPLEFAVFQNNHLVGNAVFPLYSFRNVTHQTSSNNYNMTNDEANNSGYLTSEKMNPPTNGATIDIGYNMTSVCANISSLSPSLASTACLYDTTCGVVYNATDNTVTSEYRESSKRVTWDVGAFEYDSTYQYTVTTLNSPTDETTTTSQTVTFNITAIDNTNLQNVTLYGNWSTGWHANETKSITGTSNTTTFTKTLPYGTYKWNALAYDEDGNSDWSNLNFTFTIEGEDITAPTYSGAAHTTTEAGTACTFGIQYNDNSALHTNGQYIFATNNTGAWVNESAINFTATPQIIETAKTLNSTVGLTIGYRWYASDNAGNTADTSIYTLETTETLVTTYVNVVALSTDTSLAVSTDMTGATFTSVGYSVWDYEKGIDLFTGVGGLIVLAAILVIVGSVIVGMRGEMEMEKLIGITIGILVLVVIFPMIVMTGAQMEDVSNVGDGSTATLTITDVPSPGQTLEINSETFTLTDGTPGPYLVDIGSSPSTTYVASQIVDSINTYSSIVSAE